ncbi:MAG: penicillin-binding protein 2 [Nocardioides sp.]|nr:penicillin-binding protein 2 [Nocardioides sp.]
MNPSTKRDPAAERSRLRLIVVRVLVFSLFATLFARLYYLQVVSGDSYRQAAASQSLREVVVQPQRGLIVDDQGRPLVANRTAWVVSVDRTLLGRLSERDRKILLRRLANAVRTPLKQIKEDLVTCGERGSVRGRCWNGSPYQPVPVATGVRQAEALRILEQPEDYPGVLAQQQSVRAYPRPYGVNLADVIGYLSPITAGELNKARKDHDTSVNGASTVGRAGIEEEYDRYLRGRPGYQKVAVDSMGRVLGNEGEVKGHPGDTLVTSIDARVQSVTEKALHDAITTARATYDPVTHRNYSADSGAAIVLEAKTGRVVAMASQPTYNPGEWVGGISREQLARLYSPQAGDPLLARAYQGQFAPGSTWKPFMTVGAFNNGMGPSTMLDCSSGFQVGNRLFHNYESASYGMISFAQALQVSCDTFFYRVGYYFWQKYGQDPTDVHAHDPLVSEAKAFGFGRPTGIDVPGESAGRIADRAWKLAYWKSMKGYYCGIDKHPPAGTSSYLKLFAHEFCLEGNYYRAGDAVNFVIGQGDTLVTPLQLARAYAALANGGTLYEPRIAKAIVSPSGQVIKRIRPKVQGHVTDPAHAISYVDNALLGTAKVGTMAWKMGGFPLDQIHIRSKTGSAEVYGKQSTSWVASYDDNYVVLMMVTQGGTGSGTSGPFVRRIWEALYGVHGMQVDTRKALIPGVVEPAALPAFQPDGSILPPRPRTTGSQP